MARGSIHVPKFKIHVSEIKNLSVFYVINAQVFEETEVSFVCFYNEYPSGIT